MPASTFQKKAIFFLVFSGVIVLILIGFPLFESWLQDNILPEFALKMAADGKVMNADNTDAGMMATTTISLAVNIFHVLKVFLWMALIISIVRFVSFLIFETAFRRSGQSEISSLLKTVLSVIIYLVAFFIIFQSQYPGVQLAPLFTGSAILGIVVGLALQDTLGNLFAGIALQADQPFQVGDVVSITNRGIGVVEGVSWRGVKIRTFQNKLLVISNAVLGKETIEVAPRDNLNARAVFFNTLYNASPAKTAKLVRETARHVENVSIKIRPVVRIRNLGDSGIEWEVKYWLEDYTKFNDTDALIRERIWYAFQREKIGFSFPTRTIHIETQPEEATADEFLNTASEQLGCVSIFAPLSQEELEKLAHASTGRVFAPGEAIVRRGQEGNSMFVITRGSVKVQIPENSYQRTINNLRANDFFGEMSLLTGQPRTANVVAEEETEVLQIRKTALKPLFEANPELMKLICDIVEERRELLKIPGDDDVKKVDDDAGVLRSLRRFFGMK
ncbi:MAG TPA: mechanosensitive ion channel family protein [Pyrinomonadaceae bacterium]|nr:mechanosensitive ion channel family protein [Pyrinomonadaceae bacterium]